LSSKPQIVNGLAGASYLYYIEKHFESALVVIPSDIDLERACEALRFFAKERVQVWAYPEFERLFEPLRQEPEILYERMALQAEMAEHPAKPRFILTHLEALAQKTLPAKALLKHSLRLKRGEWAERDKLLIDLQAIGYQRDDLAEDQGFFSVRGHLIDIFPPLKPSPFRIEFFGDEIVSIRAFDPVSQRSLEEQQELVLYPIRESISSPALWERARSHIKNLGDDRGVTIQERERLLFDLENHRDVVEPRWLLPAFFEDLESLFDYFHKIPNVVFLDRGRCVELFQKSVEDDNRSFESLSRLSYTPDSIRLDPFSALPEGPHELFSTLAGKGLSYNVRTFEDLRDKLIKSKSFGPLESEIRSLKDLGLSPTMVVPSAKRREALYESLEGVAGNLEWVSGPFFDGFASETFQKAFITERDIFGVKKKAAKSASRTKEDFLRQFSDLSDGDYVIHEDHGISRFRGLQKINISGGTSEFLVLEYADNDKLYLPVYRLDKLSRYVSDGYAEPRLDRLGSQTFVKRKGRIREDILKIAHELLQIAAKRKLSTITRAGEMDEKAYQRFCQDFPYDLTSDQEAATLELERDLHADIPMDRLVCGDVGFGKTEVAMRAAALCLLRGMQVAVLAPTTILVEQHYRNFLKRFSRFPFRIQRLSRFIAPSEQKKILTDLENGQVDLVIGTHRLLGQDVKFSQLGLLIVDEEQRFGVKHKEKIKKLKGDLDILTMSATPIPRTLQMAVTGVRELSLITTPPENREAVKTYVASFDAELIKKGVEKELARGGQVLFVHNRVQTIQGVAAKLKEILPNVRMTVAHGQMSETELEEKMLEFIEGRSDMLIATTIIENGLDIPNANTLFVDHAHMFGLSNLYQLRGRVGRSHIQAYAYFLIHENTELTKEASKRLQVIQSCTELGSGFNVATHDLEIRGSGNILGEEQSGVIAEVGLELYTQMLHETLAELRDQKHQEPLPDLNTGYTAFIPESYIPDPSIRIATYKQLNRVRTPAEILALEDELLDRFGLYPRELENFCQILRLRSMATALKAESIDIFPGRMAILLRPTTPLEPTKVIPLLGKDVSLDPKGRISFQFPSSVKTADPARIAEEEKKDFQTCRNFLRRLFELSKLPLEEI